MTLKRLLILSIMVGLAPMTLSAAIVTETDFESYSVGTLPTTNTLPMFFEILETGSIAQIRNQTTATPFGTPNQFLEVGGRGMRVRSSGTQSALMSITFDLLKPSGTGDTSTIRFGLGLNDINSAGAAFAWTFENGTLDLGLGAGATLASGSLASGLVEDRHYVVNILSNRSGSSEVVSTSNGDITLGNNQAALFFLDTTDNTLISSGIVDTNSSNAASNFYFRGFNTEGNRIYVDNYVRTDDLSIIPEPGTFALLFGLVGLAVGVVRRRRK